MIEQMVQEAMQYFAKSLQPKDKGWEILEVNANGCKEFYGMFGQGNHYLCMSQIQVGGVEYLVKRPDLSELSEIEDKSIDLVIHTLTLQQTWNTQLAVMECFRILKPGGFLLINCPWIAENRGENDYWRISHHALSRLLDHAGFDQGRVAMWNDILTAGIARRPNDSKS